MHHGVSVYLRYLHDRRRSAFFWTLGAALMAVMVAAFYPAVKDLVGDFTQGDSGLNALMGVSADTDISKPPGYLWSQLYSNVLPWVVAAYGVSLGTACIAGDEDEGTLEYLLAYPATRTQVAFARFLALETLLLVLVTVTGLVCAAVLPLFDLTAGITVGNFIAANVGVFCLALFYGGFAFMLGAAGAGRGMTLGVGGALAAGGYILYTLAATSGKLQHLMNFSIWNGYINSQPLLKGWTFELVGPPLIAAAVFFVIGWQWFLRRDIRR